MSQLLKKHANNHARVLTVSTPHGKFTTPTFMPVGTRAYVNLMTAEDLTTAGSQIILGGNTYHMLCAPGLEVIESLGGMHAMMQWHKPMLTDSGGFQVFSLSENKKLCKIDEKGAHFKVPNSGQVIHLTPELSMQAQKVIGADIIMAFDQCTPDVDDKKLVEQAMQRTHRWLQQCKDFHTQQPNSAYGKAQALFGIIQGSCFQDLREQSAEFVVKMQLDGIAIGGESIGFDMAKTVEIMGWIRDMLPADKPRYTMGVGLHPQDLIDVVASGADMFDCVAPTRNARHGSLYCGRIVREDGWLRFENSMERGRLQIKKAMYAKDEQPIMADCDCHTCQHYTRGYLHFLFKENAHLYYNLACIHNVRVMHRVCEVMRECIINS